MADFPSSTYSPRTKNNKSGVVYTPANDTQLYAEDVEKLDDEVVALEENLADKIDRIVHLIIVDKDTVVSDGDGLFVFIVPAGLNGYNLISAEAAFNSADSSSDIAFQIYNITQAADMLESSNPITIETGEKTSYTAADRSEVDTDEDGVTTGDELRIDNDSEIDDAEGLQIFLTFRKPIT